MQRWLRHQTHREVLVTTTEDQTFEGVLAEDARDGVILRCAKLHRPGDEAIPLGGEVFIPRDRVSVIQFPHRDRA